MNVAAAWFSNTYCGYSCAPVGQVLLGPLLCCCLQVPVRIAPLPWHALHVLLHVRFVQDWRSSCHGWLWKHPVHTWISRFCQLLLVLSFPWAVTTSDICSIHGYGKPHRPGGIYRVADTALSPSSGPAGAGRDMFQRWLQAVLVPGRSLFVAWVVLGAGVVERRGWSVAAAL